MDNSAPSPGEVWDYSGNIRLIIRNHGGYCSTLSLLYTKSHPRQIDIMAGQMYYADPGMVKPQMRSYLGEYKTQLEPDEFERVRRHIADAMGFERIEERSTREVFLDTMGVILDKLGVER